MRILLVEDHASCAEGFLELMETYVPEATVVHCSTLQTAADALTVGWPFDVIVLDLNLPDAKETVAVRLLVRLAPEVPIVVYTAYPQFQEPCLDLGVGAFCVKASIDGHDLADTIRRIARGDA